MNTQAHVVAGLWCFGRRRQPELAWPLAIGGLLPDAPMFVFYAVQKIRGVAEATIWTQRYFDSGWQTFFDLFNSLPLMALAALVAWRCRLPALMAVVAAMALHALLDLPLHHEDAHRHLFPFSDWRFASPISYWDPARHGAIASLVEIIGVAAGIAVVWRRFPQRSVRVLLGLIAASYIAYFGYVFTVWV